MDQNSDLFHQSLTQPGKTGLVAGFNALLRQGWLVVAGNVPSVDQCLHGMTLRAWPHLAATLKEDHSSLKILHL